MVDNLIRRLERIREKLERLGGLEAHEAYRPVVSASVMEQFERSHGVRLPEDYRAFVQVVMAGGHGPYYGLTPFEFAAPDVTDPAETHLLRSPFPVSLEQALQPDAPVLRYGLDQVFSPGELMLCHQGRGYYASLVVSGTARGRVVYLNHDREGTAYFVRDANFTDWYERWLDWTLAGRIPTLNAVLNGVEQVWFGYDNPAFEVREYQDDGLPEIEWRVARRRIDA